MSAPSCAACVHRTHQTANAQAEFYRGRGDDYAARLSDMRYARNFWRIVAIAVITAVLAWAAFSVVSTGIERGIAWGETDEAAAYWRAVNEGAMRDE